ncbi:MFS transporter [Bacillus sp. FJAT-42376]|uniref:MFS transporter n=1 Tax=Bacillus sp. FJAT-42376 TaxID=2014076 RepID=UPI000F4FAF9E|nr:MFS transporter [Bacillus sp. FJAT-42376]AZB43932.1 MFS transporter [Bacillus sp. FJAT-42376]
MKTANFRYLWMGQTIANAGDIFYAAALIALLYHVTGSAFSLAAVPFSITAARFLSGLAAPVIMDKWKIENILAYSQAGKTVFLLLLALSLSAEETVHLFFVFTCIILISTLDGWAAPAKNAMLPGIVPSEELVKANSFTASIDQSVQLGGWAAGGLLTSAWGSMTMIWLTAALYALSAYLLVKIKLGSAPFFYAPKQKLRNQLKDGWLEIWRIQQLRTIHFILLLETAAGTVWIAAILYLYVKEQLHLGEEWWGYINASFFAGLIAGGVFGVLYSSWMDRNSGKIIITGAFGISAATFIFGVTAIPWIALAASALFGVMEQLKSVSLQTAMQRSTPAPLLTKIYSAQSSMLALTFGLGSLAAGAAAERVPISAIFLTASGILLVSAFYTIGRKQRLSS